MDLAPWELLRHQSTLAAVLVVGVERMLQPQVGQVPVALDD